MEVGKTFNNIGSYNTEMSKSLNDKLFFVDRLPKREHYIFVDFGCADGKMIGELVKIYGSNCKYIGYDCSETMIKIAKANFEQDSKNVLFTHDWHNVTNKIDEIKKPYFGGGYKVVVILSSVIHEVYSYAETNFDINIFWQRVNEVSDYIVVRDMMPARSIDRVGSKAQYDKIIKKIDPKYIEDFEKRHGDLSSNKNQVHFLLKYRWIINWDREVNENYFPIYVDEFFTNIDSSNDLIYFESFRVPFLDACIKKDFDIELTDNTHIKAIFKKNK